MRIAILRAVERIVFFDGFARLLKKQLFLRLNALDCVVGQEFKLRFALFAFVLVGDAGDFAFLKRAAFDGHAYAAKFFRHGFHDGGFADAVLTADQRGDGNVFLIGSYVG